MVLSLTEKIKADVKRSGTNKGKLFFVRENEKARVRFLQDMDEGYEFKFHDSFERGINTLCQEQLGRSCPYCDDEDLRTRSMYAWSVYDYEAKEVKLFLFAVNNCSPVPALMSMYETYGVLSDRDYVISVQGKQMNKTYSVVPMDKVKFRNEKAKPMSKAKALKILAKAYPIDEEEPEDDEDIEVESDYEDMSPKDLFKLCKERDIDAKPKKTAKYYITLLEEADEANDDWGDDDTDDDDDKEYASMEEDDAEDVGIDEDDDGLEEDDWEESESEYEGVSAKELYKICKERGIKAKPKKDKEYYIELLEDDDFPM